MSSHEVFGIRHRRLGGRCASGGWKVALKTVDSDCGHGEETKTTLNLGVIFKFRLDPEVLVKEKDASSLVLDSRKVESFSHQPYPTSSQGSIA